jgi:4-amino-4-deoxy-L-arabinose transferase-like glycosyltransferase
MSAVDAPALATPPGRAAHRVPLAQLGRLAAPFGGILGVAVVLAALLHISAFGGAGLLRALYPFPVDGVEPGAIQEVRRILQGQPVYTPPELGYVPLIYGPVYFYASALLAALSGSVVFGLRGVSLLASLGAIALVIVLVRRETGNVVVALAAGAVLAACGPLTDQAMDIGRMDALALALMLGAVTLGQTAVFRPRARWWVGAGSGALMGLSLLTKQSGVPVALALAIVFVTLASRRQLLAYALALLGILGVVLAVLVAQSGRWPIFYLWDLPRRHELQRELLMRFWSDILARFALPLVVGPFFLLGRWLAGERRKVAFYGVLAAAMIGTSWASQANIGGGRNVQLPAYAALSLLFGLGLAEGLRRLQPVVRHGAAFRGYVLAIALAQLTILLYNPRLIVPYSSDRWGGERLAAAIAALPPPVFAGAFQGYTDGQSVVAPDLGAVLELQGAFGGTGTPEGSTWEDLYGRAVQDGRFSTILVDPEVAAFIVPLVAEAYGYEHIGPLFPDGDVYWAWRTGWTPKVEVYRRQT